MRHPDLQKIAEGREAEIFAWRDGAVLRLLRNPNARHQVEWEAAAMRAAQSSGARVPSVHEVVEVEGRPGLVMERVEGKDYLTLLGQKPWRVLGAARVLGEVHARLHEARAPDNIPELKATLRGRIERSDRVPQELKPVALEALERLPDGNAICHGDYHPANLIVSSAEPAVIDWTNVTRGDADADVGRTLLLLRLGEPPPGTPLLVRLPAPVGRRVMVWGYLRSYRRLRPVDVEAVARWEPPLAAARLTEGIKSERAALLAMVQGRASPTAAP